MKGHWRQATDKARGRRIFLQRCALQCQDRGRATRSMGVSKSQLWAILGAMLASTATLALVEAQSRSDVVIADRRLTVTTTAGSGLLRIFLSADWTRPREEVTRVVVIFHGAGRNAVGYFKTAVEARKLAGEQGVGAMIIAPHFLETADLERNPPADAKALLRWKPSRWKHGWPASAPAPLSSFDAIDAIVDRLADRTIFPNLGQVILAGHSAGGQILQRWPALALATEVDGARDTRSLRRRQPVVVRLFQQGSTRSEQVVLGSQRLGLWHEQEAALRCQGGRQWILSAPTSGVTSSICSVQRIFIPAARISTPVVRRKPKANAVWFAATPISPTCKSGMGITHRLHEVPGAGHSAGEMFKSQCGVGVLFDRPGCDGANVAQLRTTAASKCAKRSN